jgi:glutaredoxin-like protein
MAFLSTDNRNEVQELFKELNREVDLIFFTQRESPLFVPGQECETCKDTRVLLEEIAGLSEKIRLQVHEYEPTKDAVGEQGIDRVPALVITADGVKGKVRYFGMPSGYEFSVLLGTLLNASKGKTELSESVRETLQTINQTAHIQVFVTPTCRYCPAVASLAHQMAIENEHITADVIEINEFPHLAQRYSIRGVPMTLINETVEFVGNVGESQFVEHLQRASAAAPKETNEKGH